jgi:D-amino-acid dehydrogenase
MNDISVKPSALIIGAGIIGIACAHSLNKLGYAVTVIDQNEIGSGCSAGNCGHILPSHILPLNEPGAILTGIKSLFQANPAFRIKPQLSISLAKWLWEFSRRCTKKSMLSTAGNLKPLLDSSINEFQNIIKELNCDWQSKGMLYVFESEQGAKKFSIMNRMLSDDFGVSANFLTGKELTTLDPAYKPHLAGAFHYIDDTHVDPSRLINQWTKQLKGQGVKFISNCKLESISKHAGQISHLNTTQGQIQADHYVIAAGAWSQQLARELNCSIPIQPGKGYSATMERLDASPTLPAFYPEHGIGITPFSNSFRIGSMMEFTGFDTSIPETRISQLKERAIPYLVEPYTNSKAIPWQGWRPMTWDSLPVIGRTPNLSNAYMAAGHNMLGLSMATGTGKLVAEIVSGAPTHIDAQPYSPNRF